MQLPQPKVLVPALFALVAGVPMLLQTSFAELPFDASVFAPSVQETVKSQVEVRRETRMYRVAFQKCMELRDKTKRKIKCPEVDDPKSVERFLDGIFEEEDAQDDDAMKSDDAKAIELDPTALTYTEKQLLNRALRSGTCPDVLQNISEAFFQLCERTLDEMGSVRAEAILKRIRANAPERLHSAPVPVETLDKRIETFGNTHPSADDVPRVRYRRDGSGNAPVDTTPSEIQE